VIPIYIQLTNELIKGIANGSIKPHDELPSVRSLAADLSVNMHTVIKSYHELEKKGFIRIIPKSGAVVNAPFVDDEIRNRIARDLEPIVNEAIAIGLSENEALAILRTLITQAREEEQ